MLRHHREPAGSPARVVVLGSRGFLGAATVAALRKSGIMTLAVPSTELDLASAGADDRLAAMLRPDDALVMFSALTPDKGKDIATMNRNVAMATAVCAALAKRKIDHAIYISSDAVYGEAPALVDERTPAAPDALYGVMHLARELMFRSAVAPDALCILRPTLIYGAADSHNSYGSNRFRRQAAKEGKISIFGDGEETRDHVLVDDVAELIRQCLIHKSAGVLNAVSGRSLSFLRVAELVAKQCTPPVPIERKPRGPGGVITHRSYDIADCRKAFPSFRWTAAEEGFAKAQRDMLAAGGG